jgi:thioredoxin reductase (NADPH)
MTEPNTPLPLTASRAEQIFPTLTSAQIARIAKHGRTRTARSGEVLVEQGARAIPFFVVISGELEAVRPTGTIETLLFIVRAGQFAGEINILSGRSAMAHVRTRQDAEILQLARESFLTVVQTDAELSEIVMRAFILRRVELLVQGIGDATVVGSSHSADTLRIKEFLTRNGTRTPTWIWNAIPTFKASSITSMSPSLRRLW